MPPLYLHCSTIAHVNVAEALRRSVACLLGQDDPSFILIVAVTSVDDETVYYLQMDPVNAALPPWPCPVSSPPSSRRRRGLQVLSKDIPRGVDVRMQALIIASSLLADGSSESLSASEAQATLLGMTLSLSPTSARTASPHGAAIQQLQNVRFQRQMQQQCAAASNAQAIVAAVTTDSNAADASASLFDTFIDIASDVGNVSPFGISIAFSSTFGAAHSDGTLACASLSYTPHESHSMEATASPSALADARAQRVDSTWDDPAHSTLSSGAIAAIAVGVAVTLILIVSAFFWNQRGQADSEQPLSPATMFSQQQQDCDKTPIGELPAVGAAASSMAIHDTGRAASFPTGGAATFPILLVTAGRQLSSLGTLSRAERGRHGVASAVSADSPPPVAPPLDVNSQPETHREQLTALCELMLGQPSSPVASLHEAPMTSKPRRKEDSSAE